jgi:membrane-associated protease RseP (regulator of RpoE activity)
LSEGNGHGGNPAEIIEPNFPPMMEWPPRPAHRAGRRKLWPALVLFFLTVLSTLTVGAEFAQSYTQNREPFSGEQNPLAMIAVAFHHPSVLALGVPFSFTLLAILLAHEMGHYFAGRYYGIDVSYPYFIPAPTLIGTFGAFIRIRSPITTRRALFDVGLAGPMVGFVFAVPAMAWAVAVSKIMPGVQENAPIVFGAPALMRLLVRLFHPGVHADWILLHPVGRAAWVGLFATALNLLPASQLDGGHIVYSLTSRHHQRISLAVGLCLLALASFGWIGWAAWGVLLLVLSLRYRHPPVLDRWEPLDASRRLWAIVALAIFGLCFTPWPVTMQ